jgi:SAM-dependent methyltransferase
MNLDNFKFYDWIFKTMPMRWDNKGLPQPTDTIIIELLKPYWNKKIKIIDLGCGNGRTIDFIYRPEWIIYGVDYVPQAVKEARKNLRNKAIIKLEDMTHTSFNDKEFDIVLAVGSFEHIEPLTFAEPKRLVKDDGLVIIEVPISDTISERMVYKTCYNNDTGSWGEHFEYKLTENDWIKLLKKDNFNVEVQNGMFICKPI